MSNRLRVDIPGLPTSGKNATSVQWKRQPQEHLTSQAESASNWELQAQMLDVITSKIVEVWVNENDPGLLQQLGAIHSMGG